VTNSFGELIVHHKVVNVFLGSSQLQFTSQHRYY